MQQARKQYRSIPLRSHQAKRNTTGSYVSHAAMPALPDEDQLYQSVNHTSARREALPTKATPTALVRHSYTDNQGRRVIEDGNKRLVIQNNKPGKRGFHWLLYTGFGMLVMVVLWQAGLWTINTVQAHNLDSQYGYPRTYQLNAVVKHHDSASHPSHFIFENLNGQVIVIEIPGGDVSHSIIYSGPRLFNNDASSIPVTGSFEDVNGDGLPDMEIHIQDQTIVFLNNGTKFVPQQ